VAVRKRTGAKIPAKTASGSARGGRKGNSPNQKAGRSWGILFWLAFAILFVVLFYINREAISNSIETIKKEISGDKTNQSETPVPESSSRNGEPDSPSSSPSIIKVNPVPESSPSSQTQSQQTSASRPPAQTVPKTSSPVSKPAAQSTAEKSSQTPQAVTSQNMQSQTEIRERALYFIHVDRGGSILRERVTRKIPVSDSPMTDAIQALITGPNSEEKSKELMTLIPPNTRILSATVRGDTAYISFSEDFQYNTYGVEGYAGQLRQIVFTATEFPNIKYVQILIENRRVDYLGEGIWIGSPLSRDML